MLTSNLDKADPRWTALMVVDMQNDYVHPDGVFAKMGFDLKPVRAIVEPIRELIAAAREAKVQLVYVRNWHSEATDSEAWLERSRRRFRGGPRAAQAGSWGAEWYTGLGPAPGDLIVHKARYDAFLRTDLDERLRDRGIRTLVVCGTATNVCVESTARSAHMRDYYVLLVGDCCAASDSGLHEATLVNVERHFGSIVSLADLRGTWTATSSAESIPPVHDAVPGVS